MPRTLCTERVLLALAVGCSAPEPTEDLSFPDSGTLTALSYNVHGLPDAVTNTDRPGVERMAEISPRLNDYAIVGLQEVFTDENRDTLLAEVTHETVALFNTPLDPGRAYGAGLGILSAAGRFTASEDLFYDECSGVFDGASDCLASKGLQQVTIDLGDALLTVMNTHHEAGGGADDEAARATQVDQVVAALAGLPEDHAVIYLGDFNMRESDPGDLPALTAYADAGLRNLCVEVGCTQPERIDRIYLRDSSQIALTGQSWRVDTSFVDASGADLSDHDAIAGTIGWARK